MGKTTFRVLASYVTELSSCGNPPPFYFFQLFGRRLAMK